MSTVAISAQKHWGKRSRTPKISEMLKTLVYKVMLLSPAIFLASLGIFARTYFDPFEPVSLDPSQQAHISSLRSLVSDSKEALGRSGTSADLLELMGRWEKAASQKQVRLRPVAIDDTTQEGAKGEVLQSQVLLARSYFKRACRESKSPSDQRKALELSLRFLELGKYVDCASVNTVAAAQKGLLREPIWETWPVAEKLAFKDSVIKLQDSLPNLDALDSRIRWAARTTIEHKDEALLASLSQPIELKESFKKQSDVIGHMPRTGNTSENAVFAMKMAHFMELQFRRDLDKVLAELKSVSQKS